VLQAVTLFLIAMMSHIIKILEHDAALLTNL